MNSRYRLLIAMAVAGVLLSAGCAQSANPENDVTPSASGGPEPSFLPLPVPTSLPSTLSAPGPGKDEVVVTGTVEMVGVEGGCKALRDNGNKVYELKGAPANALAVGARVTVRGKIRTDIMTICQIGPVLEVVSSQPA